MAGFGAVHREVGGLEGLEAGLGHSRSRHLHLVGVAAGADGHLSQHEHNAARLREGGGGSAGRTPYSSVVLSAHPEGAVRDVDPAPGDHHRVLQGLAGGVGAGVRPVAVVLHLDIHGGPFPVLWAPEEQQMGFN